MSYQRGNINRDGTSQTQRFLKALDPTCISIDDRVAKDWLEFVRSFSAQINYYNYSNNKEGDWTPFFSKQIEIPEIKEEYEGKNNFSPHLGLLLAFFHVLKYATEDLNQLTTKHLAHHYKEVLKFVEQPPVPDQVHLIFGLNKNADQNVRLPINTILKSSVKDALGKDLLYKTNREIIVNKATVDAIRTVFVDVDNQHRIYAAPVANSSDGLGKDLTDPNKGWSIFGESQLGLAEDERTMLDAEVGVALASPILLLREGTRSVNITLSVTATRFAITEKVLNYLLFNLSSFNQIIVSKLSLLQNQIFETEEELEEAIEGAIATVTPNAILLEELVSEIKEVVKIPLLSYEDDFFGKMFKAYGSGIEGWFEIEDISILKYEDAYIVVALNIPSAAPAIEPINSEVHGEKIKSTQPVIQLLLNEEENFYRYEEFRYFQLDSIAIDVSVNGVRNLIIANDNGTLDASQAFLPFGATPSVGSSFYFGNTEVFNKKLDFLQAELSWADLPTDANGFDDHYQVEYSSIEEVTNDSFKAYLSILQDYQWIPVGDQNNPDEISIFNNLNNGNSLDREVFSRPLAFENSNIRLPENKEVDHYGVDVISGFGRLTLTAPVFAFGHHVFPKLYSQKAITIATADPLPPSDTSLPNPPYTPKLNSFTLNYKSSVIINLSEENPYDQVLHVEPFGSYQLSKDESQFLLPQLSQGTVYLGIKDLVPPQNLNLLFKLVEGSANPDIDVVEEDIKWSYLSNNQWINLDALSIQTDTSKGLQTSGIIDFSIGRDATNHDTRQIGNLHWIKGTIDKKPSGIGRVVNIHTQAVTATFFNQENDLSHLATPLVAETINKFVTKVPGLKFVAQPYASFYGKTIEQDASFYQRVSERLRHKQRAINIWDYERLILQTFPNIYKVKCIRHADKSSELVPGNIDLVLIPNLRNQNAVNPLEPKVSSILSNEIANFISQYTSIFTNVNVQNPKYEQLVVEMKVGLRAGFDGGYYGKLLNDELKKFLSPWAFDEGEDIIFGGKVYKSSILAFVEEQEYVEYVTDFKLYHLNKGSGVGQMCVEVDFVIRPDEIGEEVSNIGFAEASSARSILVSASQHLITVLKSGEYVCSSADIATGIGAMVIGNDFIIN